MSKLRDVATQIRNIVIQKKKFVGSFNKYSQADSVPIALMTLMSMLADGTTTEHNVLSQGALTSAQVVIYNFRKKTVKTIVVTPNLTKRHWSYTIV